MMDENELRWRLENKGKASNFYFFECRTKKQENDPLSWGSGLVWHSHLTTDGWKRRKRENWAGLLWCNEASRKQIGMRREEEDPPPPRSGRCCCCIYARHDWVKRISTTTTTRSPIFLMYSIPRCRVQRERKRKRELSTTGCDDCCAVTRRIILLEKRS